MNPIFYRLLLPLGCGLLSILSTWALIPLLKRHVMDVPNVRSNHKAPTPRGGGIGMITVMLTGFAVTGMPPCVIIAAIVLACVSFMDDHRGLPVGIRLAAQLLAVLLALHTIPGRILPEAIPAFGEYGLIALAWIWIINLTNFMDGIDGISAMEAIMVACGIFIIRTIHPGAAAMLGVQAEIVAAAACGFYLFNRHPAKVFMGDVGSIPLGFIMGYLLLALAAQHCLIPALILPAYYIVDATSTMVMRQLKGEKIWQAHSEHAYQQAVRLGITHAQVVSRISRLNAILIGLAMVSTLSMMAGVFSLIIAYVLTFLLIHHFRHARSR